MNNNMTPIHAQFSHRANPDNVFHASYQRSVDRLFLLALYIITFVFIGITDGVIGVIAATIIGMICFTCYFVVEQFLYRVVPKFMKWARGF
jgi:hypothetical protein